MLFLFRFFFFFFFNDTATTEIYTLSLHDALPISARWPARTSPPHTCSRSSTPRPDRKSTRLNSSHVEISYAVFCLKKKKKSVPQFSEQSKNRPPHRRRLFSEGHLRRRIQSFFFF